MPTQIITKNSSTAAAVPTAAVLVQGELAVNVTDKRLFTENASAAVVELGTNPSALTCPSVTITGGSITGITDLAVADGGTGASSLTGIVKGNGTSAFTAVTAPTGTIVGTTDTQTLTNKTLAFASNTLTGVQASLVSGTNIKTINSATILGSGDVAVQPTLVSGTNIKTINSTTLLGSGDIAVQLALVSGTNIKTVNNTSLVGSGNVSVQETLVSGVNLVTINGESLLDSYGIRAGSLIYLSGTFASAASSVDIDLVDLTKYDNYVIIGEGLVLSTSDAIQIRYKLGGTYATTNYKTIDIGVTDTSLSAVTSGNGTKSTSFSGINFLDRHFDCNSARQKSNLFEYTCVASTDAVVSATNASCNSGTGVKSGVRYFCNGGATITGTFRLYGVYKGII